DGGRGPSRDRREGAQGSRGSAHSRGRGGGRSAPRGRAALPEKRKPPWPPRGGGPRRRVRCEGSRSTSPPEHAAFGVGELADGDHDEVEERPKAASAEREELRHA